MKSRLGRILFEKERKDDGRSLFHSFIMVITYKKGE